MLGSSLGGPELNEVTIAINKFSRLVVATGFDYFN